jgi:hypothetical protein
MLTGSQFFGSLFLSEPGFEEILWINERSKLNYKVEFRNNKVLFPENLLVHPNQGSDLFLLS